MPSPLPALNLIATPGRRHATLEQPKAEATATWRSGLGIDAFWTGKV